MAGKVYLLEHLGCANCAAKIETNINKIDGANAEMKLEGAQFVLWREFMGQKQYAYVEDGKLFKWVKYKDEADKIANNGEEGDLIATQLTTNASGKIEVAGLKSDIYYLQETKAPEGYNLDPNVIEVDIDAVVSENTDGEGQVDSLTITVNGGTAHEGSDDGKVTMTVVNNQGATLPETGGIGTTIFYVLGGFMVVAATVLLISKKRMASET